MEEATVKETAHKLLESYLGNKVLIRVKGDLEIKGRLKSFDQHLNLVLDDAEEIRVNGDVRRIGMVIVRGDSVILVSPVKE
ncbi:MAG: LSm family protein [Desulfurococcaceae archaeon]|uniref:Putative snRNP Sm-like protein n=1 Tax=Staphylothermus marinus TaxID=2280 RepID=A0A7C4NP58_STAMA